MGQGLSLEQQLQLRQLADSLQDMSREELIEAVLEERQELLMQHRYYMQLMEMCGVQVEEQEADVALVLPSSEEELVEVFGHRPSDEELADYCSRRIAEHQEAARIDVDIEAIALGLED